MISIVSYSLVGAFSVITNLRMDLFEALVSTAQPLLCTPELSFANISLSLLLGSVIGPPLDLNTISVKVYTSVYNAGTASDEH